MKPRKPKLCKHCGEEFVQYTSLDKYCSQRCQKKGDEEKAKEKRKIAKITKGLSISAQKKKLWSVISEYIRRKYADSDGKASCVTCGDRKHWKELQAGHFCPSGSSSYLRYVESNIHPQCYRCNINLGSNPIEYREFMIREYGEKFVDQMLSLRNEPVKFSSYNIQVLRETWEDKLRKFETKVKEN